MGLAARPRRRHHTPARSSFEAPSEFPALWSGLTSLTVCPVGGREEQVAMVACVESMAPASGEARQARAG